MERKLAAILSADVQGSISGSASQQCEVAVTSTGVSSPDPSEGAQVQPRPQTATHLCPSVDC